MIVFPTENWNTFISIDDIGTGLDELGVGSLWSALSTEAKEQKLHQSTIILKSVCYVRTNSKCPFSDGQLLLVHADLVNDSKFLSFVDNEYKYKKAKISKLDVVYNIPTKFRLPMVVESMLSSCLKSSNRARGFNINVING